MSSITGISDESFSIPTMAPADYAWSDTIHGDGLNMQRVTKEATESFQAICKMYELEEKELEEELKLMVMWCIYNDKNEPVGAIQIDSYPSLKALKVQVSDPKLAQGLFSKQQTLELSYALSEANRGHGLGSKAVQTWINYARKNTWGSSIFAVVSADNKASIRILEKNGLSYQGQYIHTKTQDNTLIYCLR
jgi:RimJ/RimL family protein N-acetyltransferase